MADIDFREVFKEIKEQYREYINSPKIFGSIVQNNPSIIIQRKHSKTNHFLKVETLRKTAESMFIFKLHYYSYSIPSINSLSIRLKRI